jgi:hypothetical protein
MRGFRVFAAALCCAVLVACASVSQNLAFDASASQGLILVEVAAPARGELPNFVLNVARYSDAERRLNTSSFSGWGYFNEPVRGSDGSLWLMARVDPGRYTIAQMSHQGYWIVCFNSGTRAFDAEPGKVMYIGRVDLRPAFITIAQTLPSVTNRNLYALDQRISFTPQDTISGGQSNAEAFVRSAFPNISAPVVGEASSEVEFNTGWDVTHTSRVCGGYYAPSNTPGN